MATYYIDYVSGLDSNNGLSTSTPWKLVRGMVGVTGTAAAATFAAGDTIYFKAGVTWPASVLPWSVPNFSGTSGNPITYAKHSSWGSGSYAILDGEGTASGVIQQNDHPGPTYIVFDGFEAKNPANATTTTSACVYARSSIHSTIQNCYLHATGANRMVYAQRTTQILNCTIDGSNSAVAGDGVITIQGSSYAANDAADSIIRGNTISTGGSEYGIKVYGGGNALIEKNYIYGNTISGQYVVVIRSSRQGTVRYNVIKTTSLSNANSGALVAWTAGQVTDANQGHHYYNNTLIGDGTGFGFYSPSNDYDALTFYNNIFYDYNVGIESPSDSTITTNTFYSCVTNWGGGGSHTTSGNITTNPLLTNTASLPSGAALTSSSPARDVGTSYDSYHNGTNTDYSQSTTVPQNGTPDMGAYEFATAGDVTPPAAPMGVAIL